MTISFSRRFCLGASIFVPGIALLIGVPNLLADPPTTAPAAAPAAAPAQPSTDAVVQLLQTHQYAPALRMTNKLLSLRDDAAQGLDPYALYMLKGESYIGLKSIEPAIEAFKAAAKATSDPHELAVAKSTILLLKNSKATAYVPKTAPPGGVKPAPIPLNDLTQRDAAFAALLNDQLTTMQPRIDSASKSPSIPPIYPVLQDLRDLKDLDDVVNGNSDKTTKISAALLDHAHNMIVAALKGMWAREDEINNNANQTTTNTQINQSTNPILNNNSITTIQKAGLTSDNKTELKDMMDTCDKIHQAADAFADLAASDKDKQWAAVNSDATRISHRANDLLNLVFDTTYGYSAYSGGYAGAVPSQIYPPQQIPISGQPGQVIFVPQQQPMTPTTNPTITPTIVPIVTPIPVPVVTPAPAPVPRAKPIKKPN